MIRKLLVIIPVALIACLHSAAAWADGHWVEKSSPHSVADTTSNLTTAVEGAGATVFAVVDHAKGAASIGDELPPTTLVIFGNPKIGTPLIQANQLIGYDLPIRVLIWDDNGQTKIGYTAPAALAQEYSITGADGAIKMMTGALDKLTSAAAAQ